jgi:hypothetical protein
MKKLLFFFLFTISSVVHAQWVFIIENASDSKYFIEASSIQQVSQYKRAWTKTEFGSNTTMTLQNNIRSGRFYQEFDCREKKYRELTEQYYKQPNLAELHINSNEIQPWKFIPPETVAEALFKFICKTK